MNPISEELSLMRTTLTASMIHAVVRNQKNGRLDGRLFEIAKVFVPKALPLTEYPDERDHLVVAFWGKGEDFFTVKGAAETVADTLHVKFAYKAATRSFTHPYQTADVICEGQTVGYIGTLAYDIAEGESMRTNLYLMELDLAALYPLCGNTPAFEPLPKFLDVSRDLALVMDKNITCAQVEDQIRAACKYVRDIRLFDVYEGVPIPPTMKSMAFTLTFRAGEEEFTSEDLDRYVAKILKKLDAVLGITMQCSGSRSEHNHCKYNSRSTGIVRCCGFFASVSVCHPRFDIIDDFGVLRLLQKGVAKAGINNGSDIFTARFTKKLRLRVSVGSVHCGDIVTSREEEDRRICERRFCVLQCLIYGQVGLHDNEISEETVGVGRTVIRQSGEPLAPFGIGGDKSERASVRGERGVKAPEDQRKDHHIYRVFTMKKNISVCDGEQFLHPLRRNDGVGRTGINNTVPLRHFFIDRDLRDSGTETVSKQDNGKFGEGSSKDRAEGRAIFCIIAKKVSLSVFSPGPAVFPVLVECNCVSGFDHFRGKNLVIISDLCKPCHDLDHSAWALCFPDFVPYFLTVKRCKLHL